MSSVPRAVDLGVVSCHACGLVCEQAGSQVTPLACEVKVAGSSTLWPTCRVGSNVPDAVNSSELPTGRFKPVAMSAAADLVNRCMLAGHTAVLPVGTVQVQLPSVRLSAAPNASTPSVMPEPRTFVTVILNSEDPPTSTVKGVAM